MSDKEHETVAGSPVPDTDAGVLPDNWPDAVGRLSSALDRIAFALERKWQETQVPAEPAAPQAEAPSAPGPDLQEIAAQLDTLIARIGDIVARARSQDEG
ncbi:hypothetical protein LOC54_01455 [Acetobacter sp. AN02]|uniref:hypothetical protein n=1 Tax=Acetobacter sp. AN02 TaxID=2894186 RepID=UPI0024344EB7|nr:hypothetical protein [Acetobacter sp. AN02]MDG6093788.1 hypothetical protein [Acetobacter sp. AN02]